MIFDLIKAWPFIEKNIAEFAMLKDLDLVILRGHLLLEEQLNQIITKFVFDGKYVREAKLSFDQKSKLAKSMSLDESTNTMWSLISSINSLRNNIAHSLPGEGKVKGINNVRKIYESETKGADFAETWRDSELLGMRNAICLSIGFLQAFYEEVVRFKKYVDVMDIALNPHRHKTKKT